MKRLLSVFFAGALLATVAFAQENNAGANAPAEEQKQAATTEKECCGKDCCKHMSAKKSKADAKRSKKDNATAMACCK